MRGTIRCARCEKRRQEEVCPHCSKASCYVNVYWSGKHYNYRRDPSNLPLSYAAAVLLISQVISDINVHHKGQKTFDPEKYLAGKVKARRLEHKVEKWLEVKEIQAAAGEFSWMTLKNYRGYARNYWIPMIGRYDVSDLQYPDLEKFKDGLPNHLKKKTKRNILNGLRTFYTWLKQKGTVPEIPVFPTVKGDDAEVQFALDLEDQWEALKRIPKEHRDPIEFGMETGLRPGETCALKIKDLDLKAGMILVQRTWSGPHLRETTKGKNKRWIPLSDRAIAIIEKLSRSRFPDEFVFTNPNTGRGYRPKILNLAWRTHSETTLTHYEATRHSFCTQVVESGASALEAQRLMRHSNLKSTQHYYHATDRKMKDLVNRRGKVVRLIIKEGHDD